MQVEAAEKRRQEAENRGIKDPEKVRRMQEKAAKFEKDELEAAKLGNPSLRVNNISFSIKKAAINQLFYFFCVPVDIRLKVAMFTLTSTSDDSLLAL